MLGFSFQRSKELERVSKPENFTSLVSLLGKLRKGEILDGEESAAFVRARTSLHSSLAELTEARSRMVRRD